MSGTTPLPQGQPALRDGLTKRQTEVIERLEWGMPVKKIAFDMGVSRAAVYQTIERLRRSGALPETYTPSGQASSVGPARLDVGPASLPAQHLAPRESGLAELRDFGSGDREGGAYAELIEAAIARADVPALAYELGRADASPSGGLSKELVEAALRRLGVLAGPENPASGRDS
jgi:DNA-binding CsgD family transcriptional regulator